MNSEQIVTEMSDSNEPWPEDILVGLHMYAQGTEVRTKKDPLTGKPNLHNLELAIATLIVLKLSFEDDGPDKQADN